MPKRKSLSTATPVEVNSFDPAIPPSAVEVHSNAPPAKRQARAPRKTQPPPSTGSTNPDKNANVLDSAEALRASPDATEEDERMNVENAGMNVEKQVKEEEDDSTLSHGAGLDNSANQAPKSARASKPKDKAKEPQFLDPEADGDEEVDEEELQAALSRPPPINSDYLPLPWKGRLGYACLNTYLRFANPPVFCSRTCRIASILENRHPLTHPNEPPHATKNRPDRNKPADVARGQAFVESLGKANARDIVKILRWNEKYGIRFLRLSSEMFPFASHAEYGYKLAPFVSEELAEAGRVAAELGHRLTTHPGQYTQLGSPRKPVIDNAVRDLEYHAELLSLLKLPPQQDRDAVMILHLGGVFGDKGATLDRFRENYAKLSEGIKHRLVLENDDMCWSVHDLLPLCEELNIPMVLDFHHHNIIFDADKIREGSKEIMDLFPRILATWERKKKNPKMHYSEPTPAAITGQQRRKHSPRVATLPPCPPTMDLMIEAKDKEQAVFELMRTFKLPGYDTFNDITPHVRRDENKPIRTPIKKKGTPKKSKSNDNDSEPDPPPTPPPVTPDEEISMGGPEGRVYWPPGMEEWLRPQKRVIKPKAEPSEDGEAETNKEKKPTPAQKKKAAATAAKEAAVKVEAEVHSKSKEGDKEITPTPASKSKPKTKAKSKAKPAADDSKATSIPTPAKEQSQTKNTAKTNSKTKGKKAAKAIPTTPPASTSDDDDDESALSDYELDELDDDDDSNAASVPALVKKVAMTNGIAKAATAGKVKLGGKSGRQSGRSKKKISYVEDDEGEAD